MKLLRNATISIFIIILIASIIYFTPFTKEINITLDGIESSIGSTNSTITKLHIKGIYQSYIFQNDAFKGKISIDGYDYTFYETTNDLYINIPNHGTVLEYSNVNYTNQIPIKVTTLGPIYVNEDFSKFTFLIMEKDISDISNWNGTNGKFACFPAATRDDAILIARDVARNVDSFQKYK